MLTSYKRILIYIVLIVIYLILLSIYLTNPKKNDNDEGDMAKQIIQNFWRLHFDLRNKSQLDESGTYRVLYSQEFQKVQQPTFNVTFVTQCSSNKLNLIKDLMHVWNGPISVAVFLDVKDLNEALWAVALLTHCKGPKNIAISLVIESKAYDKIFPLSSTLTPKMFSCSFSFSIGNTDVKNYDRPATPYPVNMLRNVAKRVATSDYILICDIDMLPSLNLHSDFLRYVKQYQMVQNVIYVVPAFEVVLGKGVPLTKSELLKDIQKNKVQPFYFSLCTKCQKYTDYQKWLSYNSSLGSRELYSVEYKDPWEPFYIAKKGIPDYDERFKQYGFNRISQVCELHVAGYKFRVLDDVFLVHKGFKLANDFHETKNLEQEKNRRLFRIFKQELKRKYPHSTKRC